MRVPVLTYHSINVHGNDYASNDHVALAADLRALHADGWRVVPLAAVVAALLDEADPATLERGVALSFDDGAWFDWHDLDHPTCGMQRGFAGILRDFAAATGAPVHATSFVIVSPQARTILDRTCMIGRAWWGHEWWPLAQREGLIAIENHSWDHNHDTLPQTAQRDGRRGTFRSIETWAEADAEIRVAADWLDALLAPHRGSLFAFPYGESSDYLVREYLPHCTDEHRLRAAFGTAPAPVTARSDRWNLPRYVCGEHWRSPAELARLLRG